MENLKNTVGHTGILYQVSKKARTYATVFVIFSYHFLVDKDFECSNRGNPSICWKYMILPVVLIFVLVLWMDSHFQRAWKFTCSCCCNCHLFCVLFYHILEALSVAFLWPVAVFLDGDWYVCCHTQLSSFFISASLSKEEMKGNSKMLGLSALTIIVCVVAFLSSLPWRKCCPQRVVVGEILLEEGDHLLTEKLKEVAMNNMMVKINTHVGSNEWEKCFNVAEHVIKEELFRNGLQNQRGPQAHGGAPGNMYTNGEGSEFFELQPINSEEVSGSGQQTNTTQTRGGQF